MTDCNARQLEFQGLFDTSKKVIVKNDAPALSSDGGLLLLRKIEKKEDIIKRLAKLFNDNRRPTHIKHSLEEMLSQRIFGLCTGYEDLCDHNEIRADPLLQLVCGTQSKPLSSSATLNRLELGNIPYKGEDLNERKYSQIKWDHDKLQDLLIDLFLESLEQEPKEIILDFDATDFPVHGDQEQKFFHGYYDSYCYLPLYVFCDDFPLAALLRPSDIDAAAGAAELFETIIIKIRSRFKRSRIIFRGDGGFCRESIMHVAEKHKQVYYIIGLSGNSRLKELSSKTLAIALGQHYRSKEKVRLFDTFNYRTKKSWSRKRRVIGKVEILSKGENLRYVVTNLKVKDAAAAEKLYDQLYCARGDMENRIKEQQLGLFSSRMSSYWFSANQFRLWMSTFAYVFMIKLRKLVQKKSEPKMQAWTIRTKLLKVAVFIEISVRRILIRLPESYPYMDYWERAAISL